MYILGVVTTRVVPLEIKAFGTSNIHYIYAPQYGRISSSVIIIASCKSKKFSG
jgi:hypothetical protein